MSAESFKSVCCRFYRGVHLIESIVTVKWLKNGRDQHQVSIVKRCPKEVFIKRVDCNILISIIDLYRSHYKILKVINLIFTGCIVPPATTTALASLTMLVKCTAGFNRRNFKLEQLSRPVERCMYMYNDLWYRYTMYSIHPEGKTKCENIPC